MAPQPNVGEHAGPTAVSIGKWVNQDCLVVQSHRLFKKRHLGAVPRAKIIRQRMQLGLDEVRQGTDVGLSPAERASPGPHFAEHLHVERAHPCHIEARGPGARSRCQVLERGRSNVLCLRGIQFGNGAQVHQPEPGDVVDRRLAGDGRNIEHQSPHSRRLEPAMSSWYERSTSRR